MATKNANHELESIVESERLESWKEIAAYLKRSVRTVLRWEELEGLPVHRHNHNKDATVYSFKAELDQWLAQRSEKPEPDPLVQDPASPSQTPPMPVSWQFYRLGFYLFAAFGLCFALLIVYGVWFRNWRFLLRF